MSKNKTIYSLIGMAAMFENLMPNHVDKNSLTPQYINVTPPKQPIPKGCKRYYFNANGGFSNDRLINTECVFNCIASSEKSAKNKFQKWQNSKK